MPTSFIALIAHVLAYGVNGPTRLRIMVSHPSKRFGSMARKWIPPQHVGIANQVKQSCCISTEEAIYAGQLQRPI